MCISVYDDDGGNSGSGFDDGDDLCDISGGGSSLDVYYSLKTGTWTGEDSMGDSNGLGHASGEEDGSTGTDEDDCEIWFDIIDNGDIDGDSLKYWEEVNVYGTDPTVNNSGDDLDGDGMSIEWEDRYGLNDLDPGDALGDLDGDGLTNLEEYTVRDLGSDPFCPDLFVEIDYMSGHRPHDSVLSYISDYYRTHPINSGYSGIHLVFEVDETVPYEEHLDTYNDRAYYEANYHDKENTHVYILFACFESSGSDTMGVAHPTYGGIVFDAACDAYANDWSNHWVGGVTEEQVEKVVLMHELGHCINIIDYDADGNEIYCSDSHCVMAKVNWDNCDDNPYYCAHHWAEIDLTDKWSVMGG